MVTLEMVLDPRGVQTGAAEVGRALEGIGAAAGRAGRAVDSAFDVLTFVGSNGTRDLRQLPAAFDAIYGSASRAATGVGNLSNAFQSVGGSIQVGQGITQTLAALERADVAGAGTNVARTLLEISKTGADFRQLASGVGATGGAFTALRAVMTAHPILTIATVVGLAATAFSVFSDNADKATASIDRQASSLDRLREGLREVEARAKFGGGDPRTTSRGTLDTLTALSLSDQKSFQSADVARLLGISDQDFRYLLYRGGAGESALQPSQFDRRLGLGQFQNVTFDRSTTLNAAEILLRQRREQEQIGAFQRGAPQPNLDAIGGDRSPLTQYGPTEQDFQAEMARRESEIEAFNEQLQELRDIGSQVGATFASAFESVVSGANSAREAIAGLARQLGSQVLQSVFQSLGRNLGSAFAGSGPDGRTRAAEGQGWQRG